MHVTPDDEPVAGQESRIIVSKVRPSKGSFSWKSCACYLRISDSTGNVVLNRKAKRNDVVHVPEGDRLRDRVHRSREARKQVQALPRDFAIRAS